MRLRFDMNTITILILVLANFSFLIAGDQLVLRKPFADRSFWAVVDVFIHGVNALLIVSPLLISSGQTDNEIPRYAIFSFLIATGLDIDHFVVTRSFDIQSMLTLELRPPTHSLTFAFTVAIISMFILRRPAISWVIFASIASHVIRDGSSGITPVLWPFLITHVPISFYYLCQLPMIYVSWLISWSR